MFPCPCSLPASLCSYETLISPCSRWFCPGSASVQLSMDALCSFQFSAQQPLLFPAYTAGTARCSCDSICVCASSYRLLCHVLVFTCSSCYGCGGLVRICGHLSDWIIQVLNTTRMTPEKAALKSSSAIDIRARHLAVWTKITNWSASFPAFPASTTLKCSKNFYAVSVINRSSGFWKHWTAHSHLTCNTIRSNTRELSLRTTSLLSKARNRAASSIGEERGGPALGTGNIYCRGKVEVVGRENGCAARRVRE